MRSSPGASGGERLLYFVDGLSAAFGKTFGWCILILTFTTSYEVFARYMFGAPTEWAFDASYMLYGTLFMMAGAYALSRNAMCAATSSIAPGRRAGRRAWTSCSTSSSSSPACWPSSTPATGSPSCRG